MKTSWPSLSYSEAKDTYATVHLWTQIVGKIKLDKLPLINHSWQVTFSVTPWGLTTGAIPYENGSFEIAFDFLKHKLEIMTCEQRREIALKAMPVAEFYKEVMQNLKELDIHTHIRPVPNEIADATPFDQDFKHASYIPDQMERLHQALLHINDILVEFRSRFIGKCSPVHFFWGSFDLAVSRFSGRRAPKHPGGVPNLPDRVAQEAYSHEVSSCGFWPGDERLPYAAFYAYIYPEPGGYKEVKVRPEEAFYNKELGEFILPYEVVQKAVDPEQTLLEFLQSTYEAAADLAHWNREELERTEEAV